MKIKKRHKRCFAIGWFWQRCQKTMFSGQDYIDFALADSVLHFNDCKRKHAGIFSQMGLDVGIHSHIYLLLGVRHPQDMCQR